MTELVQVAANKKSGLCGDLNHSPDPGRRGVLWAGGEIEVLAGEAKEGRQAFKGDFTGRFTHEPSLDWIRTFVWDSVLSLNQHLRFQPTQLHHISEDRETCWKEKHLACTRGSPLGRTAEKLEKSISEKEGDQACTGNYFWALSTRHHKNAELDCASQNWELFSMNRNCFLLKKVVANMITGTKSTVSIRCISVQNMHRFIFPSIGVLGSRRFFLLVDTIFMFRTISFPTCICYLSLTVKRYLWDLSSYKSSIHTQMFPKKLPNCFWQPIAGLWLSNTVWKGLCR